MASALHVIAGPGPGQLATMAHRTDQPWSAQELSALARAGVHILVCAAAETGGAESSGIELIPFPVKPESSPRQEASEVVALAMRLAGEVRAGRFVVTESAAGLGRTTMLATMTLALLGIRPGEALRRIGDPSSPRVAQDWLHDFVSTHG
ncbi:MULTISPECIES: hypothetical protein [Actinoplanes]|uniref:hypothetical protein n=1 Tax=Actinoplanes TaxID=1865 RepID=UPI0005F2A3C7|nr:MULTISPECIES: hypothetical protein [Actinoplanes]GLY03719.1 hypothetical protein Acsp01_40980 [Actinoplanes sp. NBRC 101535]